MDLSGDSYRRTLVGVTLCIVVTSGHASAQADSPETENGQRLYNAHCAICHSIGGTGGRGPRLDVAKLRRAPTDGALVAVILGGIPGTEMPGSWMISADDAKAIVGYVRSLGRHEPEDIPGDAAAGKTVYESQDCTNCHIVNGIGSSLGPELSDIGLRRSAGYLRKELIQPEAAVPDGFMMIYAVPETGDPIEGMRENEDSFSVQIRDANNQFHSFRKADLTTFRKERGKSLMPSYGQKLNSDEMDNLVAYLATLQGED